MASFECLLLFTLPFDGRAMLLAFTVEVAEDEFGLLEEAANVVPDQRFDDVGADTRVVAVDPCLFCGSTSACAGMSTAAPAGRAGEFYEDVLIARVA